MRRRIKSPGIIFDVSYSVVGFKKKIVAFLITVALGSGVLVLCSAQSAIDGTESGPGNAGFRSVPVGGGSKSKAGSLFANDPNSGRPSVRKLADMTSTLTDLTSQETSINQEYK